MPISIEKLREAARRVGADMMHSDNDLDKKLEAVVDGPEAGPSNDELVENSHPADGVEGGAPVLDGEIHPTERPNVTAIKDVIEGQSEMEIGKPIEQKQEEVAKQEAVDAAKLDAEAAALGAEVDGAIKVNAQPGKQIIINIAGKQPVQPIGGEKSNPRAGTTGPVTGMFGGADLSGTPNFEKEGEVTPHRPLTCYILDSMGDTESAGHVNTTAEAAQWFKERGIDIYGEVETKDDGVDTTYTHQRLASWDYPAKKQAFLKKAAFLTIDEVKKAGREYLNMIRTAAIRVSQGVDEKGDHILLDMNGREYALYGKDGEDFRREYAAIKKPEAAINALVEKYLWKLQPYKKQTVPVAPEAREKAQARDRAEGLADSDAYYSGHEKGPNDYKRYIQRPRASKTAGVVEDYKKLRMERDQIISQNRSRRMKGQPPVPVPPKPEVPKVPVAYAADGTYEGVLRDAEDCPAGCHVKWEPIKGASVKTAGDYWGYDNWVTGHTALMLENDEVTYTAMKNLVRNALKKKMTPKELAAQMQRIPSIRKAGEETLKFHEENAQGARDDRGAYERRQLEGVPAGDKKTDFKDKFMGLFYDIGGQSDWEQPAGTIDWEEIAASEMQSERDENPDKYPATNKEDDKFMKGVGIKMESLKTAKQPMPQKGSPEWHQLKIAIKTLQMNDAMAGVMGGPSKDEARQTLLAYGIDPAKYDTPDASPITGKRGGEGAAQSPEEIEKEAGFNFFFPGQVLREVAPELQHEIVDFPNATNTPMQYADIGGDKDEVPEEMALAAALEGALDTTIVAYVSTSPAAAAGIGRDGKPTVLEGAPLRKENDIRGLMFTDEFYGQQEGIPGKAFASVNAKQVIATIMATDEAKAAFGKALASLKKKIAGADEAKQFAIFLQKVCGEIAATFVALFKATSRPILNKVPGKGEIQLAQVEQPQGLSSFNIYNTSSRVKYLMDKLTDSEIQDAINGSSAQGAVWHEGEEGGYVYEVFVRIDDIDTDSLIASYSFITGSKE